MKTLTPTAFAEIHRWITRNARPLEHALWRYHFENGTKEAVLAILSDYQNSDGGFGHALEPDNWNPESTPVSTEFATSILRQIDFFDPSRPLIQGICRYLEHTAYQSDSGWFFAIPSNNSHPHAAWWDYNPQTNAANYIGITAFLSGFLLRYGDRQSALYHQALGYIKKLIARFAESTDFGEMGIRGYCDLLEDIEVAGLSDEFDCRILREKLPVLIQPIIHDEAYRHMGNALGVVPSPGSRFYAENRREVEEALDELVNERPTGGVWPIPWEWYNGDQYRKEFAVAENWWKSSKAIEKLLLLRRFGRLEGSL